jgi:hypothetical protein
MCRKSIPNWVRAKYSLVSWHEGVIAHHMIIQISVSQYFSAPQWILRFPQPQIKAYDLNRWEWKPSLQLCKCCTDAVKEKKCQEKVATNLLLRVMICMISFSCFGRRLLRVSWEYRLDTKICSISTYRISELRETNNRLPRALAHINAVEINHSAIWNMTNFPVRAMSRTNSTQQGKEICRKPTRPNNDSKFSWS